jgi:hypothetical protein
MIDPYELLQSKENDFARVGEVPAADSSAPATNTQPSSRAEVWRVLLAACKQIPQPLRHFFLVHVLVSILDNQEISNRSLQGALRKGFESVQRVEEARRYRCNGETNKRLADAA